MAELPAHVHELLRTDIRSLAQLEVLLHLHASEEPLSVEQIYAHVKTSPNVVAQEVAALEVKGLVERTEGVHGVSRFRYRRSDPRTATVRELARLYPTWRARIVSAIFPK